MKLLLDKWQPTKRLGKIIKRILNIVLLILLLAFIVIPFLRLDNGWKEAFRWTWIGLAILHLDHFAEYKKAREERIVSPTFSAFLLLISVYLANYWSLIPLSAGIVVPLVVGTLEVAISICVYKAIRFTPKQALILQPAKVTTAILLGSVYASAVSLFVLGHFLSETMIFVFGIIAMIMLFSSVISVISKGFNTNKSLVSTIGIIVDILSVLFLIGYLIYRTPNGEDNNNLQEIVLALTSAVIGGAITLAGVAWTIKETRKDLVRKDENEAKPFFGIIDTQHFMIDESCKLEIGFRPKEFEETLEFIDEINIQNSDKAPFYLEKFSVDNVDYYPDSTFLVIKGMIFNAVIYVEKSKKKPLDKVYMHIVDVNYKKRTYELQNGGYHNYWIKEITKED